MFAVKDDVLITPKEGVLEGITRKIVLEIALELGVRTEIRKIQKSEFLNSDEIFISSSAGGIIPVVKIDEIVFANGICGQNTKKIRDVYWKWFKSTKHTTMIDYTWNSASE